MVDPDVQRALVENAALIASILDHQNAGRLLTAAALLQRLQHNLAYVGSVAEASARPPTALSAAPPQRENRGRALVLAPAPVAVAPPAHARAPRTHGWSVEELGRLEEAMKTFGSCGRDGRADYRAIAAAVGSRTAVQVRSHLQKAAKKKRAAAEREAEMEAKDRERP